MFNPLGFASLSALESNAANSCTCTCTCSGYVSVTVGIRISLEQPAGSIS